MQITKNLLNEKIISVTDLKKRVVIYVKKDGMTLFDFSFNSLTNYNGNIAFEHDGCRTVISLQENSILIKHKLKYDFQNDKRKFYTLEI